MKLNLPAILFRVENYHVLRVGGHATRYHTPTYQLAKRPKNRKFAG